MTQAGKKSKSRKRHNSSWACTSLQPGPHTALSLPRPRARGPARPGPSGLPRRARAPIPPLLPRDAPAAQLGRRLRRMFRQPGAARAARASQNPRPGRGAASRAGGLRRFAAPARRAVHACQAAAQGPPPLTHPGAERREVARAQAGAVAILTHGGDGGGGWSGPSVTSAAGAACRGPGRRGRQRAWLRAGGAGCARGPRRLPRLRLRLRPRPGAVAWAGWLATSPALLGSAHPGLGCAARPARLLAPQSSSRSVRPPFSTSGTLRKTNRWSRSSPPCLSLTPALANPRQSRDLRTTPTHFNSQ